MRELRKLVEKQQYVSPITEVFQVETSELMAFSTDFSGGAGGADDGGIIEEAKRVYVDYDEYEDFEDENSFGWRMVSFDLWK